VQAGSPHPRVAGIGGIVHHFASHTLEAMDDGQADQKRCQMTRIRIALGVAGVMAVGACAGGGGAIDTLSSIPAAITSARIEAAAPGTWLCQHHRTTPDGPGTTVEVEPGVLTVTIGDDGTFAYELADAKGEPDQWGNGTWTLADGTAVVRVVQERGNDRGYRIFGVVDGATELPWERVDFRTSGSVIASSVSQSKIHADVINGDKVAFRWSFGSGKPDASPWVCTQNSAATPATPQPNQTARAVHPKGEVIGTVRIEGTPSDPKFSDKPTIIIAEEGDEMILGVTPRIADDGSFSAELNPGRYRIGQRRPPFIDDKQPFDCTAADVTVTDGETARVTIECTAN